MASTLTVFNNINSDLPTQRHSNLVKILHRYRRNKRLYSVQQLLGNESATLKLGTAIRHNIWRPLKQSVKNAWSQLGGGQHLNTRVVKEIWRLHAGSNEEYFVKVIHNACKRNSDLAQQLLANRYGQPIKFKELAVVRMADNFYTFFDTIISDRILHSRNCIREMAYDLGRQHSRFFTASNEQYNLIYWDTLNLAMMEELEKTGLFDEIDLRAWQRLVTQINEYMLMGYLQHKSSVTKVQEDSSNERNRMHRL